MSILEFISRKKKKPAKTEKVQVYNGVNLQRLQTGTPVENRKSERSQHGKGWVQQ